MMRAFHARGERCYHRGHGCGQSLTLAGWARLAWRVSRLRREARRQAGSRAIMIRIPVPPGTEPGMAARAAAGRVLSERSAAAGHCAVPLDAYDNAFRCECGAVFVSEAGWAICPNALPARSRP